MKRLILLLFFSTLLVKGKAQLNISPNPFTTSTTLTYTLIATDTVRLYVYNQIGQHVGTLINDSVMYAGTYILNYTAYGLPAGEYFFALQINGVSAYNEHAIYQGGAAAGINQIKLNTTPFIYPNPASKFISINYNGFKKINIVDLNGRIIKTVSTLDNTISVSDINTGEYIINVYSEGNKLLITDKLFKAE